VDPTHARIWFDSTPVSRNQCTPHAPWYVSAEQDGDRPALQASTLAAGRYFKLSYGDGTAFIVDRPGTEIWATWPDPLTLEDTATYLLGPVLGFVLRLRGVTCLHGSAFVVNRRAIALIGPPQAGKSTTAAAFSRMGHPIMADDIVALSERNGVLYVAPTYPQLRLWPDSVAMLYGSADALPRLTPTWDKRGLDLTQSGYRFQRRPLPLSAVYVLGDRSGDGEPAVERLSGRENLMALVANTYVGYLLDAVMRREEFETLARLAASVPVRRIVPSADPSHLSKLCARILDDVRS
jgi:hypothetical protein